MNFDKNASTKIKGIAVLLMLFHHLFRSIDLYAGHSIEWFPFLEWQVVSVADMSKICVALFAFVSGYGLTIKIKKKSDKTIILEQIKGLIFRFMCLFIPLLIAGQIINQRLQNFYFSDNNIVKGIIYFIIDVLGLSNLFGLSPYYGAYWYISAAIIFIILLPVIYNSIRSKGIFWTLAVIILLPRLFGVGYTGGNSVYPFIFVFALGSVFAEKDYMTKILNWKWLKSEEFNSLLCLLISITALICCYFLYTNIPIEMLWEINWGLVPVVVLCVCVKFIINIPILSTILKVLGKYSMNIYILHVFFISYLKDFIYGTGHFLISVILLVTITLMTAIILEKIEKLLFSGIKQCYSFIRRT